MIFDSQKRARSSHGHGQTQDGPDDQFTSSPRGIHRLSLDKAMLQQALDFKTVEVADLKKDFHAKEKRFEEMLEAVKRENQSLLSELEAKEQASKQALGRRESELGFLVKKLELRLKEASSKIDLTMEQNSELSIQLLDAETELKRSQKDVETLREQVAAKERLMEHQASLHKSEVTALRMSWEKERRSEIEILKRASKIEIEQALQQQAREEGLIDNLKAAHAAALQDLEKRLEGERKKVSDLKENEEHLLWRLEKANQILSEAKDSEKTQSQEMFASMCELHSRYIDQLGELNCSLRVFQEEAKAKEKSLEDSILEKTLEVAKLQGNCHEVTEALKQCRGFLAEKENFIETLNLEQAKVLKELGQAQDEVSKIKQASALESKTLRMAKGSDYYLRKQYLSKFKELKKEFEEELAKKNRTIELMQKRAISRQKNRIETENHLQAKLQTSMLNTSPRGAILKKKGDLYSSWVESTSQLSQRRDTIRSRDFSSTQREPLKSTRSKLQVYKSVNTSFEESIGKMPEPRLKCSLLSKSVVEIVSAERRSKVNESMVSRSIQSKKLGFQKQLEKRTDGLFTSRSRTTGPMQYQEQKRSATVCSNQFEEEVMMETAAEPLHDCIPSVVNESGKEEQLAQDMEIIEYDFKPKVQTTSSSQVVYTSSKEDPAKKDSSEVSSHAGSFVNETTIVNATNAKPKLSAAEKRYNIPTNSDLSDSSLPPETPDLSGISKIIGRQLPQQFPSVQQRHKSFLHPAGVEEASIPLLLKFREDQAKAGRPCKTKRSPRKQTPATAKVKQVTVRPSTSKGADPKPKIDFSKTKQKLSSKPAYLTEKKPRGSLDKASRKQPARPLPTASQFALPREGK